MEVVIQRGATVMPETGAATVPNQHGSVSQEVKTDGTIRVIMEDTRQNREDLAELLDRNGMHEKAAEVRGTPYKPGIGRRIINRANKNITGTELLSAIIVGGVTIWVGRWLLKKVAAGFGWNLFGNKVETAEEEQRKEVTRIRRNTSPTQPAAAA